MGNRCKRSGSGKPKSNGSEQIQSGTQIGSSPVSKLQFSSPNVPYADLHLCFSVAFFGFFLLLHTFYLLLSIFHLSVVLFVFFYIFSVLQFFSSAFTYGIFPLKQRWVNTVVRVEWFCKIFVKKEKKNRSQKNY
jgi:hypothetical protein